MSVEDMHVTPAETDGGDLLRAQGRLTKIGAAIGRHAGLGIGWLRLMTLALVFCGRAALGDPATIAASPGAIETYSVSDSCVTCHRNPGFRVSNPKLYYYFTGFAQSKHYRAGVSCTECHGGDPKLKTDNKDVAHVGVFAPSDPRSKVFFKTVPYTCAQCHEKEFEHFSSSAHFRNLQSKGEGPNCVTCHGSRISRVFYEDIVETTCRSCHDGQKLRDIAKEARPILQRLKVAQGLMSWTRVYAHNSPTDWSEELARIEERHRHVTEAWHRFDLQGMEKDTSELLDRLQSVFKEISARREVPHP